MKSQSGIQHLPNLLSVYQQVDNPKVTIFIFIIYLIRNVQIQNKRYKMYTLKSPVSRPPVLLPPTSPPKSNHYYYFLVYPRDGL